MIESAYYLYKLTGKLQYLDGAKKYYSDIVKYCRTDIAFSSISDVVTMKQNNELPTFFFAETMKYLYLIFAGNDKVNIDQYVFNTEAHPFKKSNFVLSEIKKRLGI